MEALHFFYYKMGDKLWKDYGFIDAFNLTADWYDTQYIAIDLDTYYMYSTDAIFAENRKEAEEKNVPLGFIQVRKSKDLVHWDFVVFKVW